MIKAVNLGWIAIFIVLLVLAGQGCAGTHKTTRTETVVTSQRAADEGEIVNSTEVEKNETTITTNEEDAGHPGIISSTLHAVGYVIVLPFLIIGSVFHMLFGG